MSKEKIEELARVIGDCSEIRPFNTCDECRAVTGKYCCHIILATKILAADYSKQSEGEWRKMRVGNVTSHVQCSNCGEYEGLRTKHIKYCPNCGAKMKGGAE